MHLQLYTKPRSIVIFLLILQPPEHAAQIICRREHLCAADARGAGLVVAVVAMVLAELLLRSYCHRHIVIYFLRCFWGSPPHSTVA